MQNFLETRNRNCTPSAKHLQGPWTENVIVTSYRSKVGSVLTGIKSQQQQGELQFLCSFHVCCDSKQKLLR